MGAHHSVASVSGAMICWDCSRSSSAFSLSRYAYGIDQGVFTQNGFACAVKVMWNSSLSIFLILPSKTVGNSFFMSMIGGDICIAVVGLMLGVKGVRARGG